MNFYKRNLAVFSKRIREYYPDIEPIEDRRTGNIGNTLWMIEQIPILADQGKIDRWIGWIQSKVHSLGLTTLAEILDLTRADLADFNIGTS